MIENAKTLPSLAKPHSTLEKEDGGEGELNLEKSEGRTSWKLEVTDGKTDEVLSRSRSPFLTFASPFFSLS